MIADLNPYPVYKESGEAWLGEVPEHWIVRRMKYVLREVDSRSTDGKEQLLRVSQYTGVTQRFRADGGAEPDTRAKSLHGYKRVSPDEMVINIMLAWNGSLGVSRFTGIVSPAYCVYRFREDAHPAYFHYLMRTPLFKGRIKAFSTGIVESRLRLYSDDLYRIEALLPPPDEQAAIVRFLNYATQRVERAIRAKRKLITLLNEQKQTIIHRAVTRGLDPNAPLRNSGIDWIGDIPAHWEVRRIKQISKILRGKFSHRPRNDSSLYDGKYPFIQTGSVARAKKFITEYAQTLNERGLAVSKMFPSGTLVMTIAANIGDVAILNFDACFPDSIVGFVPISSVYKDFLYFAFRCMKREFLLEAPVNTQGNLNVDRIGTMSFPLPAYDQQKEIVDFIEKKTSILNIAIDRTEREIKLLQEYRTRLIADIVTGKVDVREAAQHLPAEVDTPAIAADEELTDDEAIDELVTAEDDDE